MKAVTSRSRKTTLPPEESYFKWKNINTNQDSTQGYKSQVKRLPADSNTKCPSFKNLQDPLLRKMLSLG